MLKDRDRSTNRSYFAPPMCFPLSTARAKPREAEGGGLPHRESAKRNRPVQPAQAFSQYSTSPAYFPSSGFQPCRESESDKIQSSAAPQSHPESCPAHR